MVLVSFLCSMVSLYYCCWLVERRRRLSFLNNTRRSGACHVPCAILLLHHSVKFHEATKINPRHNKSRLPRGLDSSTCNYAWLHVAIHILALDDLEILRKQIERSTDRQIVPGHRKAKSVDLSICRFWNLKIAKNRQIDSKQIDRFDFAGTPY